MTDRVLICDRGSLRFTWSIVSRQAEVYEMSGDRPVKRIGWLLIDQGEGAIEFEQEPFERLCDKFVEIAATAEIRVVGEEEEPDGSDD